MAPLEMFLRAYRSGHNVLSPEMYQHFGGDDILTQIQKYDPNARWTDTDLGGGEGGSAGAGKRLDFDITKMPTSQLPNGQVHGLHGLAPSNGSSAGLINSGYKWDDDLYGNVTDSRNLKKAKPGLLEILGPMLVTLGAPMAAGALAGAGIGVPGLASAVTGSGVGGSAPGWLTNLVKQGPKMLDSKKPNFMTLAQLAMKGLPRVG